MTFLFSVQGCANRKRLGTSGLIYWKISFKFATVTVMQIIILHFAFCYMGHSNYMWPLYIFLWLPVFSFFSFDILTRIGYRNQSWHGFETISILYLMRFEVSNQRPFNHESSSLTTKPCYWPNNMWHYTGKCHLLFSFFLILISLLFSLKRHFLF